jgi:hypothetical protein
MKRAVHAGGDLPLLKMPERTTLASRSPGIQRMSAEWSHLCEHV